MREPAFTLTAGPVAASPRVLAALGSQITYDYDPIFLERFRATQRKVAELFRTEGDVVLMQGEAVLGLEAAARGVVNADRRRSSKPTTETSSGTRRPSAASALITPIAERSFAAKIALKRRPISSSIAR